MDRTCKVIIVCYVCCIIILLFEFGEANQSKYIDRQRRYLSFGNFSKFFVRLNFKANMVPWTQIFAQALGFRMNWDDPPDSFRPYRHLSRRAVYESIEILLNRNGLDGFHCVRRAICEIDLVEPKSISLKILKMIFRKHSSTTDKWHEHTNEDCRTSINTCPFSVLDISPYTDL
ncbi:uncharacterized protein LOC112044652 [Bicyclus anynana]|uniref:Uncharacterized protein LOC112044652 n=1 Tax=Bicyclus anynana TaxID=110368 RepID=A0A6J1N0F7_BICAN|nr:uncharacterized protein LOC112044652 [Bicyclus anynana]